MTTQTYAARKDTLEEYFDRTASQTWAQLTSTGKVSRIRETVRAGRDRMRALLLNWVADDLAGARVLDAGCGTGALAIEAARAGAHVTAVDVSASLVEVARQRTPPALLPASDAAANSAGQIQYRVGDMLDPALGQFDHAVAMDSLIHYEAADVVAALGALAQRVGRSIVFTMAPRAPALSLMHAVGKLFPRADRAPAIVPISIDHLTRQIAAHPGLRGWRIVRSERIVSGFYTSHAVHLRASAGGAAR